MMRVLVLVLVMVTAAAAAAGELCGDADGSGAVTVTDGVQTLRAAAGLSSSCTPARCDVDDGGTVSVTDGVNVLRAAAGLAVALRCPGAAPACTAATVTVTLAVPEAIGAAVLALAYPADRVMLPGTGDAAAERVTVLTTSSLLEGGSPNHRGDRLELNLVAPDGLDDGPLAAVRFDCLGAAPGAADFACTLRDVFGVDGFNPVAGATCGVGVAVE